MDYLGRLRPGVRGRLNAMIAGSVLMVAVVSGVAWISFDRVETTFAHVTGESMPVMSAAMRIAENSAQISATAPTLAAATAEIERAQGAEALGSIKAELDAAMAAFEAYEYDGQALDGLKSAIAETNANLEALDQAVAARLAVRAQVEEAAAEIPEIHDDFVAALAPLEQAVEVNINANSQLIAQMDDRDSMAQAITELMDKELRQLQVIGGLAATANLAVGQLAQAAEITDAEELDALAKAFEITSLKLRRIRFIETSEDLGALQSAADAFTGVGTGDGSIFELRKAELANRGSERALLQANAALASTLRAEAAGVVDAAVRGANDAAETTTGSINDSRAVLVAVLALCLLSAVLVGWLVVQRGLVARLSRLVRATRAVAAGELDTEVSVRGTDEIAEMADAVRVFQDNAREMQRLEAQQREMEAEAEEKRRRAMAEVADQFEASVRGVVQSVTAAAGQMRDTAKGIAERADHNRERGTAASAASEQASTNVQTVASAAEEMASSLDEISRQVGRSAEMARSAVDQAGRTNNTVEGLVAAAQRIGEVVGLISDIAEQTNLLALNATIEAARAGDAGKGFAVVAGEVKSLAGQTAKATEEIAGQVRAIQDETRDAVEAIKGIGSSISEIDEAAATIASAVEEQAAATQDIARNTQDAAEGTRNVVRNVGEVSQSADEAGTAAETALAAAEDLTLQSERLSEEVEGFLDKIRAA